MATLLSHPAVPLAFGVGLGQRVIPMGLLLAAIVAALIGFIGSIFSRPCKIQVSPQYR